RSRGDDRRPQGQGDRDPRPAGRILRPLRLDSRLRRHQAGTVRADRRGAVGSLGSRCIARSARASGKARRGGLARTFPRGWRPSTGACVILTRLALALAAALAVAAMTAPPAPTPSDGLLKWPDLLQRPRPEPDATVHYGPGS